MRRAAGALAPAALLAAAVLAWPGCAAAQSAEELAAACAADGGDTPWCVSGAAGARELAADLALLARPGPEIPGQASTLGRRLGGAPRVAPWIDFGLARAEVPDLAAGAGAWRGATVPLIHGGVGLGVFEGLSPLPTVGGMLSLDVVAQAGFLFFSDGDGFEGRVDGLSVGARIGLLRESFTLPGVTLSVSRRFYGRLAYGDAADPARVRVDAGVTSLRATVGKDLFAFGILAGVGWDDLGGDVELDVDGASVAGELDASRRLYFVGVSRQLGVLSWMVFELGWAEGFDAVRSGGAIAPGTGTRWFGSAALLFRL
ncbi:MAG TPA: hypothetical protein VFQ22_03415 [Longimicrobiales bacterium]|nr:hypothetical protein [Longimicrobiales bacterium]